MKITPYLHFNGQCAEAFRFYERIFSGKITMMQTFGDSPAKEHAPPEWHNKIVHVHLDVNGQELMGSDAPPPHYTQPQGVFVSVSVPVSDARRIFEALSEGGKVTMPYGATFWSPGFGMAVDRFGTPWMVNAEAAAA